MSGYSFYKAQIHYTKEVKISFNQIKIKDATEEYDDISFNNRYISFVWSRKINTNMHLE